MKVKRAVIFDLDGTLLQTLPDIGGSMNRVLERFGLPTHPIEAYNMMVGNGAVNLTARAIGGKDHPLMDQVYHAYRAEYAAHTCDQTYVYPGIREAIQELGKLGVLLTVFSNKDDPDVNSVIQHYFPEKPFAIIRGRLDGVPLKPEPDGAILIANALKLQTSEILYVGDTGTDMDCGNNANMETVGVTWGFRTREELIQHSACHIIDKPEELLNLVK